MEIVAATSFARLSGGERDHMVGLCALGRCIHRPSGNSPAQPVRHVVAIDKDRHVYVISRDLNDISVDMCLVLDSSIINLDGLRSSFFSMCLSEDNLI